MAQIRSKQIKLAAEGDLILGDSAANGSILSIGALNQIVISNGTTGAWGYLGQLRDPSGTLVVDTDTTPSQVNSIKITGGSTGTGPTFTALGTDTNIDINLIVKGTGQVLVPISYIPVQPNALVTKQYTDALVTGLDFKDSSRVATSSASDLSGFTYTPSSDDETVGAAPWTGVTSPVFDGITLVNGDRVLIKDSTDAKGNGIFTYDSGASTFVRAIDADNSPSNEVSGGMFTFVEEGVTQTDTGWVASSPDGIATLGTTDIIITQFSAVGGILPGLGLSQTGNDFDVNVDDITTVIDVFDQVVVGHDDSVDHTGQFLAGQDASGSKVTSIWDYVEDLRESISGDFIINGVSVDSSVNFVTVTNAATGTDPVIESTGTDTNIGLTITAKGAGRLDLDGILWPDGGAPIRSILVAESVNDLKAVVAPDGGGDQVLIYNDTTNLFEWVVKTAIGGNAFGVVTGDTGSGTADTSSDTLNVIGGEAITTTASDGPENLVIDLDINGLASPTPPVSSTDEIVIYDISAGGHRKVLVSEITGASVDAFRVIVGDTGTATAEAADTLTITGGEGITTTATDNPEVLVVDLDIVGLIEITPAVASGDSIVIYDTSTATHTKVTVNQFFDDLDIGVVKYDDAVATGGANEAFVAFFSFTPLSDVAVTVFFNGLALRDTGWTRTGTTLTMVDSVNGYATESGDIISARYETAPV